MTQRDCCIYVAELTAQHTWVGWTASYRLKYMTGPSLASDKSYQRRHAILAILGDFSPDFIFEYLSLEEVSVE